MKKLLLALVSLLAGMALVSCTRPIKNKAALEKYVQDSTHGLTRTYEVNKVKSALTYLPWQMLASKTHRSDPASLKVLKSKYYFVLGLSANGKELLRQLPYEQYSEMVQTLAFRLRPNVSIVTDKGKVVEAADCQFQQTYGMGKENEVLLVFNRSELQDAKEMDLKIKEFGLNIGNLDYKVSSGDIAQLPDTQIK
ncbi:MAG TPA: hypothetical protein VIM89_08080 [Mucilaginibacter sp.]